MRSINEKAEKNQDLLIL